MDQAFNDLLEKMDRLKGDALKQANRKALRQVGTLYQQAIQERAPVRSEGHAGNALPPGALKDDVRVYVHIADDAKADTDTSRVTIGPGKKTAHVAKWIEEGHENPKAQKGLKRTPAHPYIRPAADATEQKAIETYQAVMTAELQQVMNGE